MKLLPALLLLAGGLTAQTFEVATVKPTPPDWHGGRYARMTSTHEFEARNFTLREMIALAFSLTPDLISGGPHWIDEDHYDVKASVAGTRRPNRETQMLMLESLIGERFQLTFRRERKQAPVYVLSVAKNGPKLKESTAAPDAPDELINQVFPDHVYLPARNTTITQFAAMLQRGILDRQVLDETGLKGRYDFDLEWAPDEREFGGQLPKPPADTNRPGFFAALQEQVGLRVRATQGPVQALVIDHIEKPTAN